MGRHHETGNRLERALVAVPVLASLLFAAPGQSFAAGEPDYQHTHAIMANAINDFVRPGYVNFEAAACG